MEEGCEVNWLTDTDKADPSAGTVSWDPVHSLWNGGHLALAVFFAPLVATPVNVAVGLGLTGLFLLLGHSVGFHRLLIHRSFEVPRWLHDVLVWSGTVAGMSGPLWIMRTHDLRDWAQRQDDCHDYLAHRRAMPLDAWWQLHCTLKLEKPPRFVPGDIGRRSFIRFLERSWMLQQLPLAGLLWLTGGWGMVVWGISVRIALTVHGHWLVGYLAHNRGPQSWLVPASGVQAHDVPWAAVLTMGEAWHNNHHAFPGSARIGLHPGQSDWGYVFIRLLARMGLARNVRTPDMMGSRLTALEELRGTPRPCFSPQNR